MTKANKTRSALFMSIISMLLCVSMLVGTTFAWFTDEVKSGNNLIAAGNLDVELYNSIGIDENKRVNENTPLFEEVLLWEPGVVAYENLTVANVGTLALQYQLTMNVTGENTVAGTNYKLSDVLKIAVVEGGVKGSTREAVLQEVADSGASWENLKTKALSGNLEDKTNETVGVVIYWQPTANDNNWNLNNGKTTSNGEKSLQITLGINLFATQLQSETDSFDKTYDKDAVLEIPEVKVETPTADAFIAALEAGETAVLTSNLTLDDDAVIAEGITSAIDLNGYTLTVGDNEVDVNGNLIITATNGGSIVVGATHGHLAPFFVQNGGHLVIKSGDIVVNSGTGLVLYGTAADLTMTGGSITANNGQDAVKIIATKANVELLGGRITTDTGSVNIQNSDANVVINGTTLNSSISHLNSNLFVTYYGDTAPNVIGQSMGYTVIVRKGTAFKGITQNPDNAKQYYIENKAGLMNLNALLASLDLGEGKGAIVELTTDIDLAGEAWSPINSMWVTFNGNEHTISNINAGLSTDGRRSGFWGYAGAVTINDLTLENVTVSGSQAGIFVGGAEGTKINNCFLKGENTVNFVPGVETWNGIGAISGVLTESNINVTIVDGSVVNLNTNGMTTDAGCTYVNDLTGYIQANKGTVTNNGTIIKGISTAAELLAYSAKALTGNNGKAESATLALLNNIDMDGANFSAIIAQRGDTLTFLGNGYTISNVKLVSGANDNTTGQASMFYAYQGSTLNVSELILENVTVKAEENASGYAAAVIGYCEGTANLTNVDVVNATVVGVKSSGMLAGHMSGTLNATGCDVSGTVTLADFAEEAAGHYAGKYFGTLAGAASLNNCTANVTVSGNLNAANDGAVYGRKTAAGSLTIDGAVQKSAATQDELNDVVGSGDNVSVEMAAGNYTMPEPSLQGKTLTITGTEGTVIDVSNVDARDQFVTGATLVFDGVTLNFGNANYMGFANTESLTYKNCTINGLQFLYCDNVTFENCVFDSNGAEHSVWTYSAQNVSFIECAFTYGDRCVNVYLDNGTGSVNVSFDDCTFTTTNTASKGAVEINSSAFPQGANVSFDGCTAPAYGTMVGISGWDSANGATATVTVDGATFAAPQWAR